MRRIILAAMAATLYAQTVSLPDVSYDPQQPLEFQQQLVKDVGGARLYDISFASPRGGRVTAYAVVPSRVEHPAGIVWQHWGQGDRSTMLPDAFAMAKRGAASILVNWPMNRPDPPRPTTPQESVAVWLQGAVDIRRAADVLVEQYGVPPTRLAYVGHSTGATIGGVIAVAERRFRALVLMGGYASISATFPQSNRPAAEAFAAIDADRFLGRAAPAALLLQFARYDRFVTEEQSNRYAKSASEPKTVRWYDCGHEFNDAQSATDRQDWLARELGLTPRRQ